MRSGVGGIGGKYALPGLIDAHVHLVHVSDFARVTGDELLPLFLAAGVTSVRSTGDEIVAAIKERLPESRVNIHVEPCDATCSDNCLSGCHLSAEERDGMPRGG